MSDVKLESFDDWLKDTGPAALVLREHLVSVEGEDGVVFPPTFAASEDKTSFKGGYNIDDHGGGANVCLIDSVGSQANRIEPIFARDEYKELVPQVVVLAGKKRVNLLDAGHRAGDAIVRCSALQNELHDAFVADLDGNAEPLAKIAPTSLVFGVWDSRDTQSKRPRLVSSTIRAYDVKQLHRSATYNRAVAYDDEQLLSSDLLEKEGSGKRADSKSGFANALASWSHGGVIATKGIRRDATLHLAALRLLRAGDDAKKTEMLRRYVFGLALTAFTFSPPGYLRQGCNLVPDRAKPRELKTVHGDGRREDSVLPGAGGALTRELALAFAKLAARAFGVGANREEPFDPERAKRDLAGDEDAGKKRKNNKTEKK
jgi:CRISPR-associated protein Csb1